MDKLGGSDLYRYEITEKDYEYAKAHPYKYEWEWVESFMKNNRPSNVTENQINEFLNKYKEKWTEK